MRLLLWVLLPQSHTLHRLTLQFYMPSLAPMVLVLISRTLSTAISSPDSMVIFHLQSLLLPSLRHPTSASLEMTTHLWIYLSIILFTFRLAYFSVPIPFPAGKIHQRGRPAQQECKQTTPVLLSQYYRYLPLHSAGLARIQTADALSGSHRRTWKPINVSVQGVEKGNGRPTSSPPERSARCVWRDIEIGGDKDGVRVSTGCLPDGYIIACA